MQLRPRRTAAARQRAVGRRLQRGQGARRRGRIDPHRGPESDRAASGPTARGPRRRPATGITSPRTSPRRRVTSLEQNARMFALLQSRAGRCGDLRLGCQVRVQLLAAGDRRSATAIPTATTPPPPIPTWSSFITTPPFPDYTSGHSTFSGAAARVLARFYGRDDIAFVTGSDALPGVTRSFAGFSAAAAEAGVSRIYGGIHYRSANQDGLAAGAAIGDLTFANFLQPKGNRSRH